MEIELKARIRNEKNIINRLKELQVALSKPISQTDYYYFNKKDKKGFYRIRKQNNIIFWKYVKIINKNKYEEYLSKVKNLNTIQKLLMKKGYKIKKIIKKNRIIGKYKKFEICIDDIKGLGKFIEIELVSNNKLKAEKKIMNLFRKIGIEKNELIKDIYIKFS